MKKIKTVEKPQEDKIKVKETTKKTSTKRTDQKRIKTKDE